MIFAIRLKKCEVSASILGIIISELRYREKPCPIILLEVDKGLGVGFYYTILPLSLVVHLWVESSEESPLDAKEIT